MFILSLLDTVPSFSAGFSVEPFTQATQAVQTWHLSAEGQVVCRPVWPRAAGMPRLRAGACPEQACLWWTHALKLLLHLLSVRSSHGKNLLSYCRMTEVRPWAPDADRRPGQAEIHVSLRGPLPWCFWKPGRDEDTPGTAHLPVRQASRGAPPELNPARSRRREAQSLGRAGLTTRWESTALRPGSPAQWLAGWTGPVTVGSVCQARCFFWIRGKTWHGTGCCRKPSGST